MSGPKVLLINLFFLVLFFFLPTSLCQNSESEENGTRIIYLIRHGDYNQTDERDEFVGRELTPLGIAQTKLLSTRLKAMPVEFTSLISSTMTRARQTALVINQDFPDLRIETRLANL